MVAATLSWRMNRDYCPLFVQNFWRTKMKILLVSPPSGDLTIGLKYLSKTENSQVSGQYITRSLNPDAVTFFAAENMTREYSPYTLSFEG